MPNEPFDLDRQRTLIEWLQHFRAQLRVPTPMPIGVQLISYKQFKDFIANAKFDLLPQEAVATPPPGPKLKERLYRRFWQLRGKLYDTGWFFRVRGSVFHIKARKVAKGTPAFGYNL